MNTTHEAPKLKSEQSTTTFLARHSKSLFKSTSPSHIAELESFNYNYSSLPPDIARELKNTTTNIRVQYRNALQSLSKVGQQLIKTKEMLPRGEWEGWVYKEFAEPGYFTIHTAQNYMNLARLVQAHGLENLKNLPLSVMYIMARENEESFVNFILDQAKSGPVTRARYHEIKQQYFNTQDSSTPDIKTSNSTSVIEVVASSDVSDLDDKPELAEPLILTVPEVKTDEEETVKLFEVKEVSIEQQETITYNLISSLDTNLLYDTVLISLIESNKISQAINNIIKRVDFILDDSGLCLLYCMPYDIANVFQCASSMGLSYLTTVAISKETSYRPDLNLSSQWYSCCLFYKNQSPCFEEYLKDYYQTHQSFITSFLQAMPNSKTNSLIIDSLDNNSLFDEDILFLMSSRYSQYLYQG